MSRSVHVAGFDIEYAWVGPKAGAVVVFLHEGLGSLSLWKDFPAALCEAAGLRGLVYSRPGYGRSTPRRPDERWDVDYLHRHATDVLPPLLDALGVRAPYLLFGHSDGGSISLVHAATFPERVRAAVLLAPHIMVEACGLESIREAREAYLNSDLRERLARHHADVDSAFWGWNAIWLDPRFEKGFDIQDLLPRVRCPLLAIQGFDDVYGTMAQIDRIAAAVPGTQLVKLEQCGHSSYRDQREAVIDATVRFVRSLPAA